jgi:putative SOS response-associated peptidase YedK
MIEHVPQGICPPFPAPNEPRHPRTAHAFVTRRHGANSHKTDPRRRGFRAAPEALLARVAPAGPSTEARTGSFVGRGREASATLQSRMCGRYTIRDPRRVLAEFSVLEKTPALEPRYNVAPSQGVWAVRVDGARRKAELSLLRWGLTGKPAPASPTVVMLRSEGLAKRPPFADAFRHRRCLLVADGFYEWRRAGKQSFPYHFARPDGAPFGIAAIWEPASLQGGSLDACALITRPALAPVDAVHQRMPVLLAREHRERWLDPGFEDVAALNRMLADPPGFVLQAQPVTSRVNSPANDDVGCIAPMPETEQRGEQFELWPSR